MLYRLHNSTLTTNVLVECDRPSEELPGAFFHLSTTVGNQLLYTRLRDGGLEIPELKGKIPKIFANRLAVSRKSIW